MRAVLCSVARNCTQLAPSTGNRGCHVPFRSGGRGLLRHYILSNDHRWECQIANDSCRQADVKRKKDPLGASGPPHLLDPWGLVGPDGSSGLLV